MVLPVLRVRAQHSLITHFLIQPRKGFKLGMEKIYCCWFVFFPEKNFEMWLGAVIGSSLLILSLL